MFGINKLSALSRPVRALANARKKQAKTGKFPETKIDNYLRAGSLLPAVNHHLEVRDV